MDYMLRHFSRDLGSLIAAARYLDSFALRAKRALTIPLLKTMLKPVSGPTHHCCCAAALTFLKYPCLLGLPFPAAPPVWRCFRLTTPCCPSTPTLEVGRVHQPIGWLD